MEAIRIVGPAHVKGTISLSGAKNAAMPILIAALATDEPVFLRNVPMEMKDIGPVIAILRQLGAEVDLLSSHELRVKACQPRTHIVDPEAAGQVRSSLLLLGLLTGRCGRARLGFPGGCEIGERKFDLHLMGLEALGAKTRVTQSCIEVEARKLTGADINFPIATTTGTENIILAACFAEGTTRLFNAHLRPEVVDFANMLNTLGADIHLSTRKVVVHGGKRLHGGAYRVLPAWDEGVTFMCAAAATGGEVCIEGLSAGLIQEYIRPLREAGAEVFAWGGNMYCRGPERLKPIHIVTGPTPNVNTDLHPIFAAMCAAADGESSFTETRWPDRFGYVEEFRKLGMNIEHFGDCAVVRGPSSLRGTHVVARDLRCGAALAIAALIAQGETVIHNVHQLDRGYVKFERSLGRLGVTADRIVVST